MSKDIDYEKILKEMLPPATANLITRNEEDFRYWVKTDVRITMKLGEFRELEGKGLLLRLPCKVGDKIYILTNYHYQDIDTSIHEEIDEVEIENIVIGRPYWQINYDEHEFLPDDFGKTVFLTQSEAEEKLRELEGK